MPQTEIEKTICQQIVSVAQLICWMEIRLKEGRKKNLGSKYHDIQKKSLKWQSTLVCIFSYIQEETFKNEIKVHKVHKIYHYN